MKNLAETLLLTFFSGGLFAGDTDWEVTDSGMPYQEVVISTQEGSWMSVDVSPDGKTLVFDMLGDLYTLPSTGGEATLISSGPAIDRQPRFSPDGSQIVFTSDRSGQYNIWVSDRDGQNVRRISGETSLKISNAAWAPDGRYIVASRLGTGQVQPEWRFSLGLYHINGGIGREIVGTPHPMLPTIEPVLSPDGRHLFYTQATVAVGFGMDVHQPLFGIMQMDLASGHSETIAQGFGNAVTPQISADGKRLTFVRRVKSKTVLFVYDRTTGRETPVYDGLSRNILASPGQDGYYPQYNWFPDNRSVAIWAKGKLLRIDVDLAQVEEIPFTASAVHRISQVARFRHELAPDTFTVQAIHQVTTAPNGESIVFSALGRLWRKVLPDGVPKRLTRDSQADPGFEYDPQFSPDGRRIAYILWNDERGAALRTVNLRGGGGQTVITSPGVLRTPKWSPDQERIVYLVDAPNDIMAGYRANQGIYWIDAGGGDARRVADGEDPAFSGDGGRITFNTRGTAPTGGMANELKSVNLNGLDERSHAQSPEALKFRLSPDGNWLAFTQHHNIYVAPYKETGTAMKVLMTSPEVAVARVSKHAGWAAHWSGNGATLNWMLGDEYYRTPVESLFDTGGKPQDISSLPDQGAAVGLIAQSDVPVGVTAFVGARIITMEGNEVIDNGTVVVEGNHILAVGEDVDNIPGNARVINLDGKTIMPGLIDMHGHLTLHRGGVPPQKHPSLYAAAAFGVKTDFDPSAEDFTSATTAELLRAGRTVGPRYISVGGVALGALHSTATVPINSVDDARSLMRRKRELGFTTIKSYRHPMRRQKQQIIKAAHEFQVMVMPEGEFNIYNRIGLMLDGHTTIEHVNIMGVYYDDWLKLMAASGTAHTPTLIVAAGDTMGENYFYSSTKPWEEPKVRTFVQETFSSPYSPLSKTPSQPPWVRGMISVRLDESLWDIGYRAAARSMKKASDLGVLINTGAHGQINGLAVHWEMWVLHQGGMTSLETLRAATMNPATTLGLEDQIGSIKAGKLADLIVLDANPLEDIRNTNSVTHTMLNGRLYDALSMNEVGNHERPRSKFYWELPEYNGIDWNESWSGSDQTKNRALGEAYSH